MTTEFVEKLCPRCCRNTVKRTITITMGRNTYTTDCCDNEQCVVEMIEGFEEIIQESEEP